MKKIIDNTHAISYTIFGAVVLYIVYKLAKKEKNAENVEFAGTAQNMFNTTFSGVTKGGGKGTFPTSPLGGGKGGNLGGTLPTGTTTTTTGGTTTGGNTGIPSQYQNILNALLTQYGQVKYKDCYNKFVAYAQTQGLTPSSAQWYPEMVSFMRKCLSGSTGTTAVNTETGTVTTGNSANPYQAELDGLLATYGATKYRACLSNWMNYAQANGLTPQTPNYYQTMFVFMQKCLPTI
jgi:hypothetical protein